MRISLLTVFGLFMISTVAIAAPAKKIFVSHASAANGNTNLANQMDMAVCATAGQDKRFDSTCYSDVQTLMQVDALNAMMGATATACAGDDCNERLAKRVKAELILLIKVTPLTSGKGNKSAAASGGYAISLTVMRVNDAKTLAKVDQKCPGDAKSLFDQTQAATKKLLAKIK